MPNIKSSLKRLRTSEKRRMRNVAAKSRMKTAIKEVLKAIEVGDQDAAKEALRGAIKVIDKTASKGIIHKNNANRKKSRLTRKVNKMAEAEIANV